MRIFTKNNHINFIDRNNVLVGYFDDGICNENFGWFISEETHTFSNQKNYENNGSIETKDVYSDYCFNVEYFDHHEDGQNDMSTNQVIFELAAEGRPRLYLHLFNHHEGYYSHGFSMHSGDVTEYMGVL